MVWISGINDIEEKNDFDLFGLSKIKNISCHYYLPI